VVLVFQLQPGTADEELRRSQEPGSFPDVLSRQPGFLEMDLVRLDDQRTMSVQAWSSQAAWWAALQAAREGTAARDQPTILVERSFFGGDVVHRAAR
ncbi:MAG: antibiotic biosynthesis monooxygenase, partial [Alphaproteobacteria bacterium]|nr:antibiotic biosynthesis monooxygenase [Alphaproteobacteria bacterium]